MSKLLISYSDAYLNWKLGSGDGSHPTNPIRAKLAVEMLEAELPALGVEFEVIEPTFEEEDRNRLLEVHTASYVSEVLDSGESYEWFGKDEVNAATAGLMFGGTVRLVEKMLEEGSEGTRVAFNPQGAKHHAHADHSSGFCVFNDMAWAALEFQKAGKKVVYIDWDAHAGDGVQAILEGTGISTFSIHGHGIFPNRADTSVRDRYDSEYLFMNEEAGWYNYNVQQGQGDATLLWAMWDIYERVSAIAPDVIIVATGADGHEGESWGLKYTLDGYATAADIVADLAIENDAKVLIGGAGGYQPYTFTPRIWADVVKVIASRVL